SLAAGYVNTIWRRYYERLFQDILADVPQDKWGEDNRFLIFSRDSFRYFEGIPLAKLYTKDREAFLSTDDAQTALNQVGLLLTPEEMAQLDQGIMHTKIVEDALFNGPDGALKSGTLVRTVMPIMADSYVPV